MGRKFYYPKKHKYRSSGSGGIAGMLLSALSGRRSHYGSGYHRSGSFKSSIVKTILKAILKKVAR